jgi:hypothetical protein
MHRVGFESTIPAFEREKTVDALDRATTTISTWNSWWNENWQGNPKYLEKPVSVLFCPSESQMTEYGIEPGRPRWEAGFDILRMS